MKNKVSSDKEKALEQRVGDALNEKEWVMGTAESCTGGRIASMITSWPGSSKHFIGGIVSYSNEIKENLLGVSKENLENYGAVSREVVEQMVKGAINVLDCDCAVATSGIAGPEGGTKEKPVGTVWIAVAVKDKVISQCYHFGNDREENILRSSNTALLMLLDMLQK